MSPIINSDLIGFLHEQCLEKEVVNSLIEHQGFHPTQAKAIRIAHYDILVGDSKRAKWLEDMRTLDLDGAFAKWLLKTSPGWKCDPSKHSHECLRDVCDGCQLVSYDRDAR
jgi:hypothetical protein